MRHKSLKQWIRENRAELDAAIAGWTWKRS